MLRDPAAAPLLTPQLLADVAAESPALAAAVAKVRKGALERGKATLERLLGAGEVRRLDSAIAKAASAGELDAAFFHVVNLNLSEAAAAAPEPGGEPGGAAVAGRGQVLQHVYTRCQEELERLLSGGPEPAKALAVKLLRTEDAGIRGNLLRHNLGRPGAAGGAGGEGAAPLVSAGEFVAALRDVVTRARGLEGGGGRKAVADVVESARQVGIAGRRVLEEEFGGGSGQEAKQRRKDAKKEARLAEKNPSEAEPSSDGAAGGAADGAQDFFGSYDPDGAGEPPAPGLAEDAPGAPDAEGEVERKIRKGKREKRRAEQALKEEQGGVLAYLRQIKPLPLFFLFLMSERRRPLPPQPSPGP
ncbi:hypothetical protein TeGR_g93 [Tetraparma gracilis]|uniref:Uncharacterized protein n=1 Tax=Tetraparma gracilis TaxID=2962635 RepID=A0ABQ6M7A3_9STRA|nr:hypothetical protein TeGR_g93 [Tetraparma gracilis]